MSELLSLTKPTIETPATKAKNKKKNNSIYSNAFSYSPTLDITTSEPADKHQTSNDFSDYIEDSYNSSFKFENDNASSKENESQEELQTKTTIQNTQVYRDTTAISNQYNQPQEEKVKRNLSEFTFTTQKSEKYRQLNTVLAQIARQREERADSMRGDAGVVKGVFGTFGAIASFFSGPVGGFLEGLGQLIGYGMNKNANKLDARAQLLSQMAGNITDYMTNLTYRDSTILNTMDQIYSSMDNMRGSYGSQFVDLMYNYYLAQNGMTPESYSLLTGNFKTFENIGYGQVSEENGIFDTLTDGNQDVFNNVYNAISGENIIGTSFMDQLVGALYSSNSQMGYALRGYETELRNALKQYMSNQTSTTLQFAGAMAVSNLEARSENISAAETIGSEQAEAAASGARGGTTYNNVKLAELSRDLTQMQRAANVAATIANMKYTYENMRQNASASAYNARIAQEKALTGAVTEAAIGFSSIGRTARAGEREANYYRSEAKGYEDQFRRSYEEMDVSDADRMFEVLYG